MFCKNKKGVYNIIVINKYCYILFFFFFHKRDKSGSKLPKINCSRWNSYTSKIESDQHASGDGILEYYYDYWNVSSVAAISMISLFRTKTDVRKILVIYGCLQIL